MTKSLLVLLVLSATASAEPHRLLLATDPRGLITDDYSLSASYSLSEHVALRGDVDLQPHPFGGNEASGHASVSLPIYLDGAFQGPFIEPGLVAHRLPVVGAVGVAGEPAYVTIDRIETFGPMVMLGWQWTYHDHFSAAAAFGYSKAWETSSTVGLLGTGTGTAGTQPGTATESYVRIGYVF